MIPLWLPENETQDSSVFTLTPGKVALLFATGFERYKVRTDSAEARSPQSACLHRLIFECERVPVGALAPCSVCDYLFNFTRTVCNYTDGPVWTGDCVWSLRACDNTKLIGLPGVYYLHLNDETAVGTAQVWIEMYRADQLPLGALANI